MRRVDPWGLAVAAVGAVVFLLHGFGGVLSRDLGLYAYAGQQFADGEPPYVGVLNRAGPLAHMVPGLGALIARALGTDDLLTMRVLMMVLTVLAVWLTYLLGRDLFGSRAAGLAAAVTLMASRVVVIYSGSGPREKTTMLVLVVCALLAIAHRRWGSAGVATALATLTWQPAFFPCLAAAVVAASVPPVRTHWRYALAAWTRFALGGLATTGVIVGYFAVVGALDAFAEGFLLINASNTNQTGLATFIRAYPNVMPRAWGWSLWLLLGGLVAAVVLAFRSRGAQDPAGRAIIGIGAATLAAVLWSFVAYNGWADAMFAVPLAAVGVAGAVLSLARYLPGSGAVAALAAYVIVVAGAAGFTAWQRSPDALPSQRATTEALLAAAGPDVTVQSVGAPQPLVLGALTNPIRHQMFLTGLDEYVDETEPGGLAGIAADIEARRPTFVTMDHPDWYDWALPTVERNYSRIGTADGVTWYADRDLGVEKLEEMTRVVEGDR